MAGKKNLESIIRICGGQDEKYAGFKRQPCEYFNAHEVGCEILLKGGIPDIEKAKRCKSIVMYYADILPEEIWKKDGRVTDHEDLPFDALFEGLHNKSIPDFDKDQRERYTTGDWHRYIRTAVKNALLKKIQKAPPIVREMREDVEPDSESEDLRLQKKTSAQMLFSEKKDVLETNLNAKVELSWLVDALTGKIDDPDISEKERSLSMRRRTLIINLLETIRRDRFADEACRKLRKEIARTQRERDRLKSEMKYDRAALMEFFLQK
jgi:hypothetical protein